MLQVDARGLATLVVLLGGASALLPACGGGGGDSSTTTTSYPVAGSDSGGSNSNNNSSGGRSANAGSSPGGRSASAGSPGSSGSSSTSTPGKCMRQVASGSHSVCDYDVCADISDPAVCCTTVTDYKMVPGDLCGSTCTDVTTDLSHCGTCDTRCKTDDTCVAGKCLPPHIVTCTSTPGPHPSYVASCSCEADENSGDPQYKGADCLHSQDLRTVCCADAGYPDTAAGCSCWFYGQWQCSSNGTTSCRCGFSDPAFVGPSTVTACNNEPASDGVAWHCCADTLGSCTCAEGRACSASATEVTSCDVKPAMYPTPPTTTCPSGQKKVTSCSG